MNAFAVAIAGALLLTAAWIRAAGTAVTRVPRADALRDASEGTKGAERIADLIDEREQITPAVGVVVSGMLVMSAVVATAVIIETLHPGPAIVVALVVGAAIFAFGDPVPRAIGRAGAHRIAYRSAGILAMAVRLGGWANDLLNDEDAVVPENDVVAEEEAEEAERELIDSVLEFSETLVREVMTPRSDMVTIAESAVIDELIDLASEEGYSRIPVTSNGDVVGVAIVKDLLALMKEEDPPDVVGDVMRPIDFVPETKLASVLLAEMRERHAHQVMVVDEFGDIAGLVTIEDLIEELVGEIADETDEVEQMIVETDDGWLVDARADTDELEDVTGVAIPDDEWDTVGGLVLAIAERVPEEGETFAFKDLVFTVTRMQGRRVSAVTVSKQAEE